MAGKKKRKKRRSNPVAAAPVNPKPKRRRRRRGNPAPSRRRRRGNPGARDIVGLANFPKGSSILWALAADALMGFAVRRLRPKWGTGIMGQQATSPYGGEAWDAQSYMLAGLALVVGSRVIRGWSRGGEEAARAFAHAGWTQLARRVMYTEVLARSTWAQQTFGQVAQVMDTSDGTRWIQTPEGGWYAMQGLTQEGPMGALVPEGAMGYYHGLRPARAVDSLFNVGNVATFPGRDMGPQDDRDDAYTRAWSMSAA